LRWKETLVLTKSTASLIFSAVHLFSLLGVTDKSSTAQLK